MTSKLPSKHAYAMKLPALLVTALLQFGVTHSLRPPSRHTRGRAATFADLEHPPPSPPPSPRVAPPPPPRLPPPPRPSSSSAVLGRRRAAAVSGGAAVASLAPLLAPPLPAAARGLLRLPLVAGVCADRETIYEIIPRLSLSFSDPHHPSMDGGVRRLSLSGRGLEPETRIAHRWTVVQGDSLSLVTGSNPRHVLLCVCVCCACVFFSLRRFF